MTDTSELVTLLGLEPHVEGGWFRETWRTPAEAVPEGYAGPRPFATGILFLLHPGERSRWHRVRSDEMWLWHRGGPLRLRFGGDGETPDEAGATEAVLGPGVEHGERPQLLVPGGVWQSAEPAGAEPTLVTCVVAPGFHYDDFTLAKDEGPCA
ncbi:cupin domain-containing protein [Streptomyces griseocarneus]|uniref:cupin domain-containing protein n=1 Tax=Streptomyces griseocarneus TaxID=51201 RepID=UPI00167F0A9A|nr:cupin domain-containing protein [Streptomyces griseocarneus]MBZ6472087.1 cupin domain-containing protein [Streptomyces griseocarneus]GHG73903.1 cupin [Streptomyces griseocarneus]